MTPPLRLDDSGLFSVRHPIKATATLSVSLVDVPAKPMRAVRFNITLPEDLVRAIDATARNRSRFLTEAARAKLAAGG